MRRVLYLNPTVGLGGGERSLIELVSGLDRSLVEPLAACVAEGALPRALREAGVRVEINPWPAFALRIGRDSAVSKILLPLAVLSLVPHILRMARLVRRRGVDIVHTNGLKSHLVGSAVRFLTGRELVWHVRDVLREGWARRLYGFLARRTVSCLIANSRTVAETFPSFPLRRLRVVYNGLDASRYAPAPASPSVREALGLSGDDFVVGAVGALAPLKGHIHFIRAAPRILERCPRAKFLIVGGEMYLTHGHRGYRTVLEEEARRLGVVEQVIFSGYRDDAVTVMRCLHVLVHSSVYPESFGRVLVEAMACGVPVVATALGGPTEIIVSEDQGILIPPSDPEAIASAVLALASDPVRRERLSLGGRERVVNAFGVERYVREVEAVYRDVAAGLGEPS